MSDDCFARGQCRSRADTDFLGEKRGSSMDRVMLNTTKEVVERVPRSVTEPFCFSSLKSCTPLADCDPSRTIPLNRPLVVGLLTITLCSTSAGHCAHRTRTGIGGNLDSWFALSLLLRLSRISAKVICLATSPGLLSIAGRVRCTGIFSVATAVFRGCCHQTLRRIEGKIFPSQASVEKHFGLLQSHRCRNFETATDSFLISQQH